MLAVEQDGNLPLMDSDDVMVKSGCMPRSDDDGLGSLKGFDGPKQEKGGAHFHERAFAGVGSTTAEAEDEKGEALKGNVEDHRDANVKDGASMARSRALQHAVSQGVRQAQLHQQHQPQAQPQQPAVIRWERFLPQQQLRVLLVEDDDATRHVVSALLRNCSYEVTSAANGVLAWELLMDQTSKVDLVLTEVVMPSLSGIGLLTRIMSHEPLKHIPVIMMSSHDSMGVVFKCLSKGAVDFLVKPVRKNELKNLWQHIWRRCHSSSGSGSGSGGGSGSGSGSQTKKGAQPDHATEANNSGSNDESDDTSSELNIGGGSDNGSGTQSSWTKKAVEVESSHHQGFPGGLMLHSSIQAKDECMPEADYQKGKDADVSFGVNLADPGAAGAEQAFFHSGKGHSNSTHKIVGTRAGNARDSRQIDDLSHDNPQRANVVSEVPIKEEESADEQQAESEDAHGLIEKHARNSPSSKDKILSDSSSPSLLKLSLKRPYQAENEREHEVRVLKHSCSSAFSRYNNSNTTPLPAGTIAGKTHTLPVGFVDHPFAQGSSVGSSLPSSIAFSSRIDGVPLPKGNTDDVMAPPFIRGIMRSNNNQDNSLPHAFSSGKHVVASCFAKEDAAQLATGPGVQMHVPSSSLRPSGSSKEPVPSEPTHWGPSSEMVKVEEFHVSYKPSQVIQNTHTTHDPQVRHHSYHHHHHHHHIQHHYHHHHQDQAQPQPQPQPQQRPLTPQQEDSTVINAGASAPKCGSSNMVKGAEGNNVQSGSSNGYGSNGNGAVSLNGSATGSNNGSNGGQSAAAEPAGVCNVDSGTQLGAGSGLTAAHGLLLGPDQSRHARREAALNKFRQKRKERCFEKKVRYQSRKRLAEQRPRVRGQFVRQSVK